jgi:hypothetical protein
MQVIDDTSCALCLPQFMSIDERRDHQEMPIIQVFLRFWLSRICRLRLASD